MRKKLVVLALAVAALAAVAAPALGQSKSTHSAFRASVRAFHAPRGTSPARPASINTAWTPAAAMPTAVEETNGGASTGSTFYSIGGFTSFSPVTVTGANQLYNKTTNTWSLKAPIPGAPSTGWADAAVCFNAADKTIHVVDGVDGAFLYAAHQVYNTTTDTWTFLAAPNTVADGNYYAQDPGCGFIGGKMYLWGGYGLTDLGPRSTAAIQNLTWVYDPTTDTWSDTLKNMIHPRLWMGYTSNKTNAFAAGGTDNISTFAPMKFTEIFTPATGWALSANLPGERLAPGMGFVKTHLLVWGGGDLTFTTSNKTFGCTLPACTSYSTTAFNLPSAKWFSSFGSGQAVFNAGGDTGSGTPVTSSEHLP